MHNACLSYHEKLVLPNRLAEHVSRQQQQGARFVFTNGVFDILHVGHVRYLAEARALGDALIIAVNTDSSVRRLKGDRRPIVSEEERVEMLSALACVDFVTVFDTPTPVPLLEQIRPAIYVKGGDYTEDRLPETPVVRGYGGHVQILSLTQGRSSTDIIRKICDVYGPTMASGS